MTRSLRRGRHKRRRGTIVLMVALFMVPIIATMAIVLDGGIMMGERRHAQATADAAARAAAGLLYKNYSTDQGLDPNGTSKSLALSIASGNGYANDGTTSTVTVNIPPKSGSFKGQSGYAEVVVNYNLQKCFSALWGAGTMTVTARTTARGRVKNGYGVILLDPTMSAALSGTGSARLNVPNGTIAVNSTSASAAKFTGSAGATATTINITGGKSGGNYVGTVKTGVAATPDPLTGLAAPDSSSMMTQRTSQLSMSGGSATLQPGIYTGGISLTGSASVTLSPGVYYINGGGISTTGSSSITGSGVFIYNGGSSVSSISLTGSSSINLTPMTSGTYSGISIFQARTATAALSLTGTGGVNITGGIYAPAAASTLTGGSSTNVTGSFFIADSAKLTGSSAINVGGVGGGRDLRIVE